MCVELTMMLAAVSFPFRPIPLGPQGPALLACQTCVPFPQWGVSTKDRCTWPDRGIKKCEKKTQDIKRMDDPNKNLIINTGTEKLKQRLNAFQVKEKE